MRHATLRLVLLAAAIGGATAAPAAQPGSARAQASACAPAPGKTAAPASIPLGESVTVTLTLGGTCPSRDVKADIALVIDRSSSMARDGKLEGAQRAAKAFVDAMDARFVQLGVIAFDDVVEVMAPLGSDKARLHQAIDDIRWNTGTNLVDSLDAARQMLGSAARRPDAAPVIVFMTDGNHSVSSPPIGQLDAVIAAVRAAAIETYAIGLGPDVDPSVLRRIASEPSKYYDSPSAEELTRIYLGIAGRIEARVLFQTVVVRDEVPANMVFEAGSARPFAPAVSADGRTLTWTLADVPTTGTAITYRLRPTEAGVHPTNVVAIASGVDGWGQPHELTFPVPRVEVLAPPDPGQCICKIVRDRVPTDVIERALANPTAVLGWQLLLDPGKPDQPPNPRRACLDLRNRGIPFHPLFNRVLWRAGCVVGP